MMRILLKLSGEAMGDAQSAGIDASSIGALCREIGALHAPVSKSASSSVPVT